MDNKKMETVVLGNATVKEMLNCMKAVKKPENHALFKFYTRKNKKDKAVHTITAVGDGIMIEKAFLSSIPKGIEVKGDKPLFETVCGMPEMLEKLSAVVSLGEDIRINNQEAILQVQAGKRAAVKVNKCQPAEMEAFLPQNAENVLFNMVIKGKDFKNMVKKGCFAYGEDSPNMMGSITFVLNDCCLTAYSTDGHMMARSSCVVQREDVEREVLDDEGNPVLAEDGNQKMENVFLKYCEEKDYDPSSYVFSIPSGNFKILETLSQAAENIIVSVCPKQILIGLPAIMITIVSGNVNGNEGSSFGNFFTKASKDTFVIDKEEFSANMEVIRLGKEEPVSFQIKKDNLIIQKGDVAMTSQPLVDKEGSFEKPFYLDYKKLIKIFGSLENGNVTVETTGPKSQVFFYNGELDTERINASLVLPVSGVEEAEESSGEEEDTEE
ncbi:MAG: hypothetical protein IJN92_08745 [Lachnospiraceae bacterium]|nr:hypothetical protein [Lachnospiraceae bacterium]